MTAIAGITALLVFGGEVLRLFSFTMLFGIIIGTYSSIFIAAPLLGYLGVRRDAFSSAKTKEAAPVIAPASTAGADRAKAASGARAVPAPAKKAATPRR